MNSKKIYCLAFFTLYVTLIWCEGRHVTISSLDTTTAHENLRYRVQGFAEKFRRRRRFVSLAEKKQAQMYGNCPSDIGGRVNSTNAFQLKFTCNAGQAGSVPLNATALCEAAEDALSRATEKLSSVICSYWPIQISVGFYDFCSTPSGSSSLASCQEDPIYGTQSDENIVRAQATCNTKTLGSAAPMQYYDLSEEVAAFLGADANYQYPAALYKQMVARKLATANDSSFENTSFSQSDLEDMLPGSDIFASFNSLMNWWFNANFSGEIEARQYDFEQIAIHELIHGLGLLTSWSTELFGSETGLLPGGLSVSPSMTVTGSTKPYIFDKYLFDKRQGVWLDDQKSRIFERMSRLYPFPLSQMDSALNRDAELSRMATELYRTFTTPRSLVFYYPRWWKRGLFSSSNASGYKLNASEWDSAVIYTPQRYSSGSTGSHVDHSTYLATGEYLMRPFGTPGVSLRRYSPASLVGPVGFNVVNILQTIGYHTVLLNGKLRQGLQNAVSNSQVLSASSRLYYSSTWGKAL